IFDREGEFAGHVRCTHAFEFADGYAAAEDEVLRTSADAAEERAYEGLSREGRLQRLISQLAFARGRKPKGTGRGDFRTFRRTSIQVHPFLLPPAFEPHLHRSAAPPAIISGTQWAGFQCRQRTRTRTGVSALSCSAKA